MEVLSDVLRAMRVRGSVYFCDRLEAPWRLDIAHPRTASFHLVRRGECWVSSGEVEARLGPGDLVFIEAGRDHVLASHPPGGEPVVPGSQTLLLCAYCEIEGGLTPALTGLFPSLSILRDDELVAHRWLKSTLDQLGGEAVSRQPGSEVVVDRLTEVVIVELVRASFGRGTPPPLLRALADRPLAAALSALHEDPAAAWTLEGLAGHVNLSRAALARRFREHLGQPMFEYLTDLRMQRARDLLGDPGLSLYEVANRIGYASDLAFTRTFKKATGMTPTAFRKRGRGSVGR